LYEIGPASPFPQANVSGPSRLAIVPLQRDSCGTAKQEGVLVAAGAYEESRLMAISRLSATKGTTAELKAEWSEGISKPVICLRKPQSAKGVSQANPAKLPRTR
jgi:hypothetical protein